jgi:hypothetical protein
MPENRSDPPDPAPTLTREERLALTREERLAAKLRENLRRRKVQARGMAEETGALPKSPGKS